MLRRQRQTLQRVEKQKRMLGFVRALLRKIHRKETYPRAMLKPQIAFIS